MKPYGDYAQLLKSPCLIRLASRTTTTLRPPELGVRHRSPDQAAAGSIGPETRLNAFEWNQQLAGEFLERSPDQAAAGSIGPETRLNAFEWNQQLAGEFLESGGAAMRQAEPRT